MSPYHAWQLAESDKGRYLAEEKRLRDIYYIEAENWKIMGMGARYDDADESDKVGVRTFRPAEARQPPSSASSKLKGK